MVHSAGGTLLQHLKEHQLHCDVKPGDRLFYFTTCGWMMWNWLVSGLASGAAVMLFDGQIVLVVVLREGLALDQELQDALRQRIRKENSPRHVPAFIIQAPDIPRTISGKTVEIAVRNILHDRPVDNKDALANPQALDFFRTVKSEIRRQQ